MPYLGNAPAEAYSNISYQDFGTQSGTTFTLDYPAGSPGEIEVFVNNVRQEPSVAYTVSGTTLTMTGTVASTDDFYVVFQGKAQQTVRHPANTALEATTGTFSSGINTGTIKEATGTTEAISIDSSGRVQIKQNATATVTYPASGSLVLSGIPNWANKITLITNDLSFDTVGETVNLRVTVGGSAVTTSVYKYTECRVTATNQFIQDNSSGATFITTDGFTAVNNLINYMLTFYKVDDYIYKFHGHHYNQQYATNFIAFTGSVETTAAIDGFDIFASSGNLDNGSARAFWE